MDVAVILGIILSVILIIFSGFTFVDMTKGEGANIIQKGGLIKWILNKKPNKKSKK
jgi:hypothetical protein